VEWLYSGQVKLTVPQCDDAIRLCRQCKLKQLEEEIQYAFTKANSYVSTKRGAKIRNVQVESMHSRECLKQDLFLLSQQTIPTEFQYRNSLSILWRELPMSPTLPNCEKYADIIFNVRSHLFCCHKAMFWTRSDYFRALIDDHFHEGS
jgi:ankyrin repeat/BTB/POZ domain-containing protein 1